MVSGVNINQILKSTLITHKKEEKKSMHCMYRGWLLGRGTLLHQETVKFLLGPGMGGDVHYDLFVDIVCLLN